MSQFPIKTDGYCIDHFTNTIKDKIGDLEAEKLRNTACEIVQNCVDIYSNTFGDDDVGTNGKGIVTNHYKEKEIPNGTTGLIYGKVQSGKTNITIATLALAEANKFRCFIVLTSNNTTLGKQTAERFKTQLDGGPIVCHWEEWKRDPVDFARSRVMPYIKDDGVVLISTKEFHHLDNLLTVLKTSGAKNVPTIIFDDEADNASLNTNEARQSRQGNQDISDSTTFEKIGNIRKEVINHIYLQITATPQSLLLQNLDHPCKPAFCAALPQPGDSYMGGDLFFKEESPYCSIVRGEEIEELKTQNGSINPGDTWNIPSGLIFLPQEILEDFRAIHEADEGMRQAIGDDLSQIKIQPVWIGRQLRATRSNVLNPAAIGVFTPGAAIFPRNPLWKTSDIKQHTEALDELLSEYEGDDMYHNIGIKFLLEVLTYMPSCYCPGYQWDDTRIQSVLNAMNAKGVNQGILNVRRGNKGDGLELKNQAIRPWKGSGYAFSKWISKPRELYPDCPTLVVMYQKGEKINGWECPLYLPTLILPKSKFAFMFNNMNEGEESE
jgi:hypothetical protein